MHVLDLLEKKQRVGGIINVQGLLFITFCLKLNMFHILNPKDILIRSYI